MDTYRSTLRLMLHSNHFTVDMGGFWGTAVKKRAVGPGNSGCFFLFEKATARFSTKSYSSLICHISGVVPHHNYKGYYFGWVLVREFQGANPVVINLAWRLTKSGWRVVVKVNKPFLQFLQTLFYSQTHHHFITLSDIGLFAPKAWRQR